MAGSAHTGDMDVCDYDIHRALVIRTVWRRVYEMAWHGAHLSPQFVSIVSLSVMLGDMGCPTPTIFTTRFPLQLTLHQLRHRFKLFRRHWPEYEPHDGAWRDIRGITIIPPQPERYGSVVWPIESNRGTF